MCVYLFFFRRLFVLSLIFFWGCRGEDDVRKLHGEDPKVQNPGNDPANEEISKSSEFDSKGLKDKVSELKYLIITAKSTASEYKHKIESLEEKLKEKSTEIGDLSARLSRLKIELEEKKTKLDIAEAEKSRLIEKNQDLEVKVGSLQKEKSNEPANKISDEDAEGKLENFYMEQLKSLEKDRDEAKKDIKNINKYISEVRNKIDKKNKEITENEKKHNEKVNSYTNELEKLKITISELEKIQAEYEKSQLDLEKIGKEQKIKIDELKALAAQKNIDFEALKAQNSDESEKLQSSEKSFKKLQADIAKKQKEIEELGSKIDKCKSDLAKSQKNIEKLEKEIGDRENEVRNSAKKEKMGNQGLSVDDKRLSKIVGVLKQNLLRSSSNNEDFLSEDEAKALIKEIERSYCHGMNHGKGSVRVGSMENCEECKNNLEKCKVNAIKMLYQYGANMQNLKELLQSNKNILSVIKFKNGEVFYSLIKGPISLEDSSTGDDNFSTHFLGMLTSTSKEFLSRSFFLDKNTGREAAIYFYNNKSGIYYPEKKAKLTINNEGSESFTSNFGGLGVTIYTEESHLNSANDQKIEYCNFYSLEMQEN